MKLTKRELWDRFQAYYSEYPSIGLALDISRVDFPGSFLGEMEIRIQSAYQAMAELEKGAVANPDEGRMVGHYWLRAPELAPTAEIRAEIEETNKAIKLFAAEVHGGGVQGQRGPFKNILLIGIGGSALGPQFVSNALGHPITDKMQIVFFDNTDPDGMDRVMASVITELGQTLCLTISKSGGTKETRNGMLEAKAAYERAGLRFSEHAVAVTGPGSELDRTAVESGWMRRFPMWDWVGGRTSQLSAVGLLPAALQGFDVDALLRGARLCDEITRRTGTQENPAALLALMWFYLEDGCGRRDMVVLPYKDRLETFSRYLQQLVMESLGKEKDLEGRIVNQGLTVYGNKGSTDQHAYIQQLRDGVNNFFAFFIEVLKARGAKSIEVEPSVTASDYLAGFFLGTRSALSENGRQSITLTLNEVSAFTVGVLIALFERTVGFYANLIGINAYHQPGVEAGKKAAAEVILLKKSVVDFFRHRRGSPVGVNEIATALGVDEDAETIFKICEYLCQNDELRRTGDRISSRQYEA